MDDEFCYLTTRGRKTGRPHEVEMWFAAKGGRLYMMSGSGQSDWVKNLQVTSAVSVRVGERSYAGEARVVSEADEDAVARRLLAAKYQGWREGQPLSEWAQTALPVCVELER